MPDTITMVRAVLQRVTEANVTVAGEVIGAIGHGIVLLVGVENGDDGDDAAALAVKVAGLRVFADDQGHMNKSLLDDGGEALVVSQFTLLGNIRRGRRPSFTSAATPEVAEPLVARVVELLEVAGVRVATGSFGAKMEVDLVNDGPVTIVIDVRQGRVV